MRFLPTEEQEALRQAARSFVAGLPGPHSHAEQSSSYDPAVWASIVGDQGWQAIQVPEAAGGWGFGLVELMLVFEETGRALLPSPFFGTCALATQALRVLGDADQQARHLGAIVGGGTATVGLAPALRVEAAGAGARLTGVVDAVVDGASADQVLVVAPDGVFVLPDGGAVAARVPSLDPTRPLARLRLDGVEVGPSERLAAGPVDDFFARAGVLLAAEQVGGAEAMLDTTVAYSKVRHQYGRAIGSFQAVQHACADMLLLVEAARSATWYAAAALEQGLPDARLAARTAKALASDAFFRVSGQAIQLHGGIGFTWEHTAHLYFKRARAGLSMLGEPAQHREAVGRALLAGEAPWT